MSYNSKRRRLNAPNVEQDLADQPPGPFPRLPISRDHSLGRPVLHYKNDRTQYSHLVDFVQRQEDQKARKDDHLAINARVAKTVGLRLEELAHGATDLHDLKPRLGLDGSKRTELELPEQLQKGVSSGATHKQLRWPLPMDEAPASEWSFHQEVQAIVSKRFSVILEEEKQALAKRNKKKKSKRATDIPVPPAEEQATNAQDLEVEDEFLNRLPDFSGPTLAAVEQQVCRIFEHMTLGMAKRSTESRFSARSATVEQDLDTDSRAGSPIKEETGKKPDPRFPIIFDWTSVIGCLAERRPSRFSAQGIDGTLDAALKASIARLSKLYGDTSLQPLHEMPRNSRGVARGGSISERLAVIERARRQAASSCADPWSASMPQTVPDMGENALEHPENADMSPDDAEGTSDSSEAASSEESDSDDSMLRPAPSQRELIRPAVPQRPIEHRYREIQRPLFTPRTPASQPQRPAHTAATQPQQAVPVRRAPAIGASTKPKPAAKKRSAGF